jgi:hypothetical protein
MNGTGATGSRFQGVTFQGITSLTNTRINRAHSPFRGNIIIQDPETGPSSEAKIYWHADVTVYDVANTTIPDADVYLLEALFENIISQTKTDDSGFARFVGLAETITSSTQDFTANYKVKSSYDSKDVLQSVVLDDYRTLTLTIPLTLPEPAPSLEPTPSPPAEGLPLTPTEPPPAPTPEATGPALPLPWIIVGIAIVAVPVLVVVLRRRRRSRN